MMTEGTSGLSKPKSGSGEIVVPFDALCQIQDVVGVWTAAGKLEEGFGVSVTSIIPRTSADHSGFNVWDNRGNSITVTILENEIRVRWGLLED